MTSYNTTRRTFKAFIAVIGVLAVNFGFQKIYDIVATPILYRITNVPFSNLISFLLLYGLQIAEALTFILLVKYFKLGFHLETGKPNNLERSRRAVVVLLVSCGLMLVNVLSKEAIRAIFTLSSNSTPFEKYQDTILRAPSLIGVIVPTAIILGPIAEEIMYRGFLTRLLRQYLSMGMALVISSLVFALIHWIPNVSSFHNFALYDLMPLAFMGYVLGLVYFRYGLVASFATHAIANAINMFAQKHHLFGITVATTAYLGIFVIISLLITQIRGKINEN